MPDNALNQALQLIEKADDWQLSRDFRIVIIGAGVGGLAMAHRLKAAGAKDVIILEKAQTLGGTWRENTYPGIACDVPAHLYSFTFSPNPDWTQSSAPGAEIHAYLNRVADTLDLRRQIFFGKNVIKCTYGDARWLLDLEDGEVIEADIVIAASGFLHFPHRPHFDGEESFEGAIFHSAQWDHSVPLEGRRVGVIGTGSTATQIVSALGQRPIDVTMFQRTPQWVYPLPNDIYSDEDRASWRADLRWIYDTYNRLLTETNTLYGDVAAGDAQAAVQLRTQCEAFLATVKDPDLRAKLTPTDPFGCKRLVMSSNFYDIVQRDNVELVTATIERIEPKGIRTTDGVLHELDVIVTATGYKAHDFCKHLNVWNENGRSLDDHWKDGPTSLQSMMIAGFPNFIMIGGPYSPFGNQSYMTGAELQTIFAVRLIKLLEDNDALAIVPNDEAERQFIAENDAGAIGKQWMAGCKSWFLDAKRRLHLWTRRPDQFIDMMYQGPSLSDYRLIGMGEARATVSTINDVHA